LNNILLQFNLPGITMKAGTPFNFAASAKAWAWLPLLWVT